MVSAGILSRTNWRILVRWEPLTLMEICTTFWRADFDNLRLLHFVFVASVFRLSNPYSTSMTELGFGDVCWQVLDGQENSLQVAAPPKTYSHVPRNQATLDSFLQSAPLCEGPSSGLAPEPLLDPALGGQAYYQPPSEDGHFDKADYGSDSKRKRLFWKVCESTLRSKQEVGTYFYVEKLPICLTL